VLLCRGIRDLPYSQHGRAFQSKSPGQELGRAAAAPARQHLCQFRGHSLALEAPHFPQRPPPPHKPMQMCRAVDRVSQETKTEGALVSNRGLSQVALVSNRICRQLINGHQALSAVHVRHQHPSPDQHRQDLRHVNIHVHELLQHKPPLQTQPNEALFGGPCRHSGLR
jgi:hypothetical protein